MAKKTLIKLKEEREKREAAKRTCCQCGRQRSRSKEVA